MNKEPLSTTQLISALEEIRDGGNISGHIHDVCRCAGCIAHRALQAKPVELKYQKTVEDCFQDHIAKEAENPDSIHPDGCWYCGGNHPSDCCPERGAAN